MAHDTHHEKKEKKVYFAPAVIMGLSFWLFAFFFLSVGLFFNNPAPIGIFLLPVLLWNVLGGFNTDLANTGYQFFWYTPVYHAAFVMKAILFNTQPHLVSRSVVILFLWWFIVISIPERQNSH
jgi:hypothetical protein